MMIFVIVIVGDGDDDFDEQVLTQAHEAHMLPEFFYFSDSLSKSREDSSLRGEPRGLH